MNPAKIVVEYPGFAPIAFRTPPRLLAAPPPRAKKLRSMLLAHDERP